MQSCWCAFCGPPVWEIADTINLIGLVNEGYDLEKGEGR